MDSHRIRLSDHELAAITRSLAARLAMLRGQDRTIAQRLIARLDDGAPGNPHFRFSGEELWDTGETDVPEVITPEWHAKYRSMCASSHHDVCECECGGALHGPKRQAAA
jgi:hypothetical protein